MTAISTINSKAVAAAFDEGLAHYRAGRLGQAEVSCRRVLAVEPDHSRALHLLGVLDNRANRFERAEALIRRAIEVDPAVGEFHNSLGIALSARGKITDAVEAHRRALNLKSGFADAHNNLGLALLSQGNVDGAISEYRRAVEISPDHALANSNLLFCLNYRPIGDRDSTFTAHRNWAARQEDRFREGRLSHANPPDPDRRLRVGYVSPDLRTHSVAYFFEALLAAHDRARVDVVCYADTPLRDGTTQRLRDRADAWRDVCDNSDTRVAERIREDCIDILVDLTGHTGRNRLLVFARKPAPVQVSFIGYCNTTGLACMDYRLTDAVADPDGAEAFHSESLVRLPRCFLCYTPEARTPPVGSLPARRTGHVTFGSFNNLAKTTPEVVAVWSKVLNSVPDARILLKSRALHDASVRRRYLSLFAEYGIGKDRVELAERTGSKLAHLALYGRLDIALDPFPYNGTTTTCEAVWMGVPVVTLAGEAHAGRVGASLLSAIGAEGLIAESVGWFRKAAALRPDFTPIHNNLGDTLQKLGRLEEAAAHYRDAIALNPASADLRVNLANALRALKRADEAEVSCREALRIDPGLAEAHNNLDIALHDQGRLDEAVAAYRDAIARKPALAEAHNNLGNALKALGRLDEAIDAYRRALAAEPDNVLAHNNLGVALHDLGRHDAALAALRRAVDLKPDLAEAHNNLGNVLKDLRRHGDAIAAYRNAIAISPDLVLAHNNLGNVLVEQGRMDEATESFKRILAIGPNDATEIKLAMMLPAILKSSDTVHDVRRRFETNVANLLERDLLVRDPVIEIGAINFYLAYHGCNDRDLQVLVARLFAKSCPSLEFIAPHCQPPVATKRRGKIAMGFISRFFSDHSVGTVMHGVIAHLARDAISVTLISLPQPEDPIANDIRLAADSTVVVPPILDVARETIAGLELDVLVYSDIGMDPFTYFLAFSRLATVQCVMGGHPVTTGIPTIDYFISSRLLEANGADAHYR